MPFVSTRIRIPYTIGERRIHPQKMERENKKKASKWTAKKINPNCFRVVGSQGDRHFQLKMKRRNDGNEGARTFQSKQTVTRHRFSSSEILSHLSVSHWFFAQINFTMLIFKRFNFTSSSFRATCDIQFIFMFAFLNRTPLCHPPSSPTCAPQNIWGCEKKKPFLFVHPPACSVLSIFLYAIR